MKAYTTLDFREAVMPPKDAVPAFVPLDDETVAYLRKRLGPTKRESYDSQLSLEDYPSSDSWTY